jgi:hypothetical protein
MELPRDVGRYRVREADYDALTRVTGEDTQ